MKLQGSEKQIKWAYDIIAEVLPVAEKVEKKTLELIERKIKERDARMATPNPEKAQRIINDIQKETKELFDTLRSQNDASYWIEFFKETLSRKNEQYTLERIKNMLYTEESMNAWRYIVEAVYELEEI